MTATLHGHAIGIVRCPGCNVPMRLIGREPVLFSNSLMDVTYHCDTCETLTQRTMRKYEPGGPMPHFGT
jgi:hypothetical protein